MVYFFYGDNNYAAKQQIGKLIKRYQDSMDSDFGLSRFESDTEIDNVITAMTSLPMLATHSLVIIDHPSRNKALCEAITGVVDRVPQETVVVIYDPGVDKRSKWYKFIKDNAKAQEFAHKSEVQLTSWLKRYAQDQGLELDNRLARLLMDMVGEDQWQLSKEIDKHQALGEITEESIKALVLPNPKHTIFELIDTLSSGDIAKGLSYFDDLKQQNIHDLEILTMLGWQLRNLLAIAYSNQASDAQIAKDHGINPFVIRKSRYILRTIDTESLESLYHQVIEADYAIKSGQGSSDSQAILERVMLNIAKVA